MKREDLLKNKGYWISKIQIDLYNQLEDYMKINNINRTGLAKRLGFSKGYITQVLKGDFDHRISKLVEFSLAINKVPEISFNDLDQLIMDDIDGFKTVNWQVKTRKTDIEKNRFEHQSGQEGEITEVKELSQLPESAISYS